MGVHQTIKESPTAKHLFPILGILLMATLTILLATFIGTAVLI